MNKKAEYNQICKMFDNNKHAPVDMIDWAYDYYTNQINILTDRRNFWTHENVRKFLDEESKKHKKVKIKIKRKITK